MPKYNVQVLASMTLDFTVEAANEQAALVKMQEILEANDREANPSPEGHSHRNIIESFQNYCADYGPDRTEITEQVEKADDALPTI